MNGKLYKTDKGWRVTYTNKKGKKVDCTAARYMALHSRLPETEPCWNGHYDCAAVDDGPCSHEVAATAGLESYLC